MTEDRVGAIAEGDVAGGDVDVPGGDSCGLLDNGEQVLLMLEGGNGAPTGGDVSEEDDDAVVGGTDQNGEPEVERFRIEGFELAGDALVHGALGVVAILPLQLDLGELVRDLFAEQIALEAQQLGGAAVEEGELPVAIEADDGVGGGFENLMELADRGVAQGLGPFAVGDVLIVEGDALVGGADVNIDPGVDGFAVSTRAGWARRSP